MPPSFDDLIKEIEIYESEGCSTDAALKRLLAKYPAIADHADQLLIEKQRREREQRFGNRQ